LSGGGGGKKGGSAQAELPRGFTSASEPFGRMIGRIVRGGQANPGAFGSTVNNALDFYQNLFTNPDLAASAGAYRDAVSDPTKLTDPLFLQERERLGGMLNEEAAKRGGIYSTGAQEGVSRGLSDFTNRYLTDASNRRLAAAAGLAGQTFQTGQAAFDPFRFFASAVPGLAGGAVLPPPQYNNAKSQDIFSLSQLAGSFRGGGGGSKGGGSNVFNDPYKAFGPTGTGFGMTG
jgi:hypothetical protein